MGIAQNIKRLRNNAGLTQDQLAARVGVARTTVTQWESGSSHPRHNTMQKLADVLGVTESDIVANSTTLEVHADTPATVPLVALGTVHAGTFSDTSKPDATIEVPSSVLASHPKAQAVLVEGDCMDRVVPDGMAVIFDPDLEPTNGSIVIVETQDYEVLIRRWYRGSNTLMLVADSHTNLDDIVITGDEPIRVIGTVVFAQSPALLH